MGRQVLCVDDDPLVLQVTRIALERNGYQVLTAADGIEAIARFEREREEIALVVLDWLLPGLTGEEVAPRLMAIDPEVRILVTSGQYCASVLSVVVREGVYDFLPKPYSPAQLIGAVEHALGMRKLAATA